MGRIETEGQVLVDLRETMEILGKSRATIFRMLSDSTLIRIAVRGRRTLYITLDSIERSKKPMPEFIASPTDNYYLIETEVQRERLKKEIARRFSHTLRSRPGPLQKSLPFPDLPLLWAK